MLNTKKLTIQGGVTHKGTGREEWEKVKAEIQSLFDYVKSDEDVFYVSFRLDVNPIVNDISASATLLGPTNPDTRGPKVALLLFKLRQELKIRHWRVFPGVIGVSRTSLYNWFDGARMSREVIKKIISVAESEDLKRELGELYALNDYLPPP